MGQSLVNNYIHIIFSTKHRLPLIQPAIEKELHTYIAEICNNRDTKVVRIGGYTNHIHILCLLSKNIPLAKLMKELKTLSSIWMKSKGEGLENFYWQDGYGAFSVSQEDVATISNYIENQHEHHSTNTFEEEYRTYLQKYSVEYNEKYVWD